MCMCCVGECMVVWVAVVVECVCWCGWWCGWWCLGRRRGWWCGADDVGRVVGGWARVQVVGVGVVSVCGRFVCEGGVCEGAPRRTRIPWQTLDLYSCSSLTSLGPLDGLGALQVGG